MGIEITEKDLPQQVLSYTRSYMRLQKIQDQLKTMGISFKVVEENDCGSINFIHRGLSYYIWEFPAPERGAESNIRTAGRGEDFEGDYEDDLLEILKTW